jgi:hypothetical protein
MALMINIAFKIYFEAFVLTLKLLGKRNYSCDQCMTRLVDLFMVCTGRYSVCIYFEILPKRWRKVFSRFKNGHAHLK